LADDLNPVGLSRDQLQLVTDPSSLSNSEREEVKNLILAFASLIFLFTSSRSELDNEEGSVTNCS
jgi:hypothetical protein